MWAVLGSKVWGQEEEPGDFSNHSGSTKINMKGEGRMDWLVGVRDFLSEDGDSPQWTMALTKEGRPERVSSRDIMMETTHGSNAGAMVTSILETTIHLSGRWLRWVEGKHVSRDSSVIQVHFHIFFFDGKRPTSNNHTSITQFASSMIISSSFLLCSLLTKTIATHLTHLPVSCLQREHDCSILW